MKRAKLIYNPNSGDKSFKNKLDTVIDKLQKGGYEITPYRTSSIDGIYENISASKKYDCILVAGGDGTINHVVNAMVQHNINVPLGIFPFGTANDFAAHLRLTKNVSEICKVILEGKTTDICLGKVNERYFVNVAAAGLLTDISQKIDINMKNTLGKMAYYIKGIEKLPEFKPIAITIKNAGKVIKEKLFLFVILNGSMAGGFTLAPDSTADDETLNFIGVKTSNIIDLFNLFIKMLRGDHLESNNVIYFKGKEFIIECDENLETDIDGEIGPEFPLHIRLSSKKLKVFTP
jgi:YegS/Rv2252/BmrU family lipid kinase